MFIGLFLSIFGIGLIALNIFQYRQFSSEWEKAKFESTGKSFNEFMFMGLPSSLEEYLKHSIKEGTPLVNSLALELDGELLLKEKDLKFTSENLLSPFEYFISKTKLSGGISYEHWKKGKGETNFKLFGVIPISSQQNEEVTRHNAIKFALLLPFIPSAFLLQQEMQWKEENSNILQISFFLGAEKFKARFELKENGSLTRYTLLDRDITYEVIFLNEKQYSGYTLPSEFQVFQTKSNLKKEQISRVRVKKAQPIF